MASWNHISPAAAAGSAGRREKLRQGVNPPSPFLLFYSVSFDSLMDGAGDSTLYVANSFLYSIHFNLQSNKIWQKSIRATHLGFFSVVELPANRVPSTDIASAQIST